MGGYKEGVLMDKGGFRHTSRFRLGIPLDTSQQISSLADKPERISLLVSTVALTITPRLNPPGFLIQQQMHFKCACLYFCPTRRPFDSWNQALYDNEEGIR